MKLEDSVLYSTKNGLRQYLKLPKAKLLLCCHPANCCHMLVRGRQPVSDEQVRNETLRKSAIFRDSLQLAASQAGAMVQMEHIAVKPSESRPSHVPKSGQALWFRTHCQTLKSPTMAGL